MYARITTMAVIPERIDEVLGQLNEVRNQVESIPGLKHWFSTSDKGSGEGVVIAIYDTKENADAAASKAQQIRDEFTEFFLKPPDVNEYEVDGHFSAP
ncbi:MAG: antibiotic biosynthesis monooxygenase family protein [Acidimicrobiia bacterium]